MVFEPHSARDLIKRLGQSLRRTGGRAIALPVPYRVTIAVFPGLVALLVLLGSFWAIRSLEESRGWVEHTHQVITESRQLLRYMVDAETGHRAYLMTRDSAFLEPYIGAEQSARTSLIRLGELTSDNSRQVPRLARIDSLIDLRFLAFKSTIASAAQGGITSLSDELRSGKHAMDDLRDVVASVETEEQALLRERDIVQQNNHRFALLMIVGGGLLAVVISLIANRTLAANITALDDVNRELYQQALRLEEQATELESQAVELEATATELEAANVELEEQTVELEHQRDVAQAARADAEQANAAKSRFLSTMSHELRTPLNAVTGYIDLMDAEVHGPVTAEQREDIRRIKRAVAQLTSVINDILNFAKLESGEVRYDLGPVEMQEALTNASALMEPQAAAKRVLFSYTPCETDIFAFADRERLQQIVLNLLSNAVKYTNVGGSVTMQCIRRGEWVVVTVADTGNGIASENMDRIFDPFVQLLNSTHAPSDGVGLGLAIGRDLARGMGGDITVSSALGKGSTFELLLPLVMDEQLQASPVSGNGPFSSAATSGRTTTPGKP